jgi:hypothetical protein
MKPLFALLAAASLASPTAAEDVKSDTFTCPALELPQLKVKDIVLTLDAKPPEKPPVAPGRIVVVNAIFEGGSIGISYPKGGSATTTVEYVSRSVGALGSLKVGDVALDARPGHGHNVVTIKFLFANCKAYASSRKGGAAFYDLADLRRKLE